MLITELGKDNLFVGLVALSSRALYELLTDF